MTKPKQKIEINMNTGTITSLSHSGSLFPERNVPQRVFRWCAFSCERWRWTHRQTPSRRTHRWSGAGRFFCLMLHSSEPRGAPLKQHWRRSAVCRGWAGTAGVSDPCGRGDAGRDHPESHSDGRTYRTPADLPLCPFPDLYICGVPSPPPCSAAGVCPARSDSGTESRS